MARRKRKRNASRGSVNNIILKTLTNGDKYGYEIIKEVEEYSSGKIQLKQPSLYSSLSRFEEKKFVTSYWGDSDIGGRRHYYHLTEEGLAYYKKVVLKEDPSEMDEDFDEDVQEILEDNNIHLTTEYDEDDELDNIGIDDNDNIEEDDINYQDDINEEKSTPIISALSEDAIPAIVNFEVEEKKEEPIAEHVFYSSTPIENMLLNNNSNDKQENVIKPNDQDNEQIDSSSDVLDLAWQKLVETSKKSNKVCSQTNFSKLYLRKPKKEKHVVRDADGILKLRDEDYTPTIRTAEPVIIDNVIKRTKNSDIFGYAEYTQTNKNDTPNDFNLISDEEKLKRNENFVAKFNLITMSKMKPVSAPAPRPPEKKPEKNIDYRGKLNAIYEISEIQENNDKVVSIKDELQPIENNLFNYTNQDVWQTEFTTNVDNQIQEEDDDKFIEFEATEEFEVKQDNKKYIEEITTYNTPASQVKMSRYEHKTNAVLVDKTYLLNNKLKFVFGIIMTLLMIAEVSISWLLFNKFDLISENDKTLLIISCVLIGIFALSTVLPFIFNSNSHKANNFKFKYSFWFGILTFLVCSILIYCANALAGFELDNINYFAVKLFLPFILVFNFVIAPVVYYILIKRKGFYD